MRTSQERRAMDDGYVFSGVYNRFYDREKTKARAAELRKEGYRARIINTQGGQYVYIKDTDKTLAVKAEKARIDEEKRVALAEDVHRYLTELDLSELPAHKLNNIRWEVERLIEKPY